MKRQIYAAGFILVLIFFLSSSVSAGFFDWFQRTITGKATGQTTSLNITLGVSPVITNVIAIAATDPSENGVKEVYFNFTVRDDDGAGTINMTSATGAFNYSTDPVRANYTCKLLVTYATTFANFSCNVQMQYFDSAAVWSINASIKDNSSNYASNFTTVFTYNELTAMVLAPSALTWPSVAVTATNTGSNNDPVRLNNTGNDNATGVLIAVTGRNLWGETDNTKAIFAGNFTVAVNDSCDLGPAMVNATNVTITGASLPKGNHSVNNGTNGQEDIYFCLEVLNNDLTSQSYSTAVSGAWVVAIFFVLFAISRRRELLNSLNNIYRKRMKLGKGKILVIYGVIFVLLFSFTASAFGVSGPYWDSNPLKLLPGESADFSLTLQNMVGDEDLSFIAELRQGSEVVTLIDPSLEYFVPAKRDDIKVNLRVEVPENAQAGESYRVSVYFEQIASGSGAGNVQIASGIQKTFDVIVAGAEEERFALPPQTSPEAAKPKNYILLIVIILIIILAAVIFYLKMKKRNIKASDKSNIKTKIKK